MDYADFFGQAAPGLVRMCFLATLDREVAADAAQEALTRAWRDWERIGADGSNPEAWVRTVALNLCRSRWRRVAGWFGRGLAYVVLGLTLLILVVLVAINVPPVSGFVAGQVNSILEPQFQGRLVLLRLGHLDFGGISSAKLEVRDAQDRWTHQVRRR